MLLNYLKLSLRLLTRSPFFTSINVLGLSVGFASFFILWQHAITELKTDQHHKDFERIARVCTNWIWESEGESGHLNTGNVLSGHLPMFIHDFPEIEDHTRFIQQIFFDKSIVGLPTTIIMGVEKINGEKKLFNEFKVICADSNLFEFFNIPLILGEKKSVLQQPHTIVLSRRTAHKYFGNDNPMGQLITLNDTVIWTVSGVFEDLPTTTHLNFEIVLSNASYRAKWDIEDGSSNWAQTYIKLSNMEGFKKLEDEINANSHKYWDSYLKKFPEAECMIFLQPLRDAAFSNYYWSDSFQPKSRFFLVLLSLVSILILVMAWINYINLTLSRTMKRLKEVATRKVSGASVGDFMSQFLIESLVINSIAIGVSLTFIQLIRLPFNLFFQIQIPEFGQVTRETWFVVIFFILTGIVLTALYPVYMSRKHNPRSLQTVKATPSMKRILPSILTTFQYTVAFVLILWGFIIYSQLNFILHKDLGFRKAQVVILDAPVVKSKTYEQDLHAFLTEIGRTHPITYCQSIFGDELPSELRTKRVQQNNFFGIDSNGGVDETFIPFFNIKILAGRNFIPNDRDDVVILSQVVLERLGFKSIQEAIGERVHVEFNDKQEMVGPVEMEIIGIIQDYPMRPYVNFGTDNTEPAKGICLTYKTGAFNQLVPERIAIQMNNDIDRDISDMEDLFKKQFPGSIFNWYFLDDHINLAYHNEKIAANQIGLFTCLAIGISCLGLLGMISNKLDEKTKEIGIRKVLGADLTQVGSVLLQATTKQLVFSVALSMPIAYYLSVQNLERFSERIDLQWWHFFIPVFILLIIMLVTISSILLKAIRTNPIESLRYE